MSSTNKSTLSEICPVPFDNPQVEQIALLLQVEMEAGEPHGTLYAEMLASALCVHLLKRERKTIAQSPALVSSRVELQRVVTFILDNLGADLSLDTLSHEAGLSPYHFAHLFTRTFGIAPHQYVIRARIEWAKALITRGLPLGDTAQCTGFSDQGHFTRHFKRLVGITPHVFVRDIGRKIVL